MRSAAVTSPGGCRAQATGRVYNFVLDGRELTDPYARFLPDGVHGAAMVVEPSYRFEHPRPAPRPLFEHVLYELHVGTFTPEGTYAAAAEKLRHLVDLGVTLLELMPLSSFAGRSRLGLRRRRPLCAVCAVR